MKIARFYDKRLAACWTSSDAKTQWGDSCRISFSFCFSWFSMLSLEWSFNYVARRPLIRQSSSSVPWIAKIVRFLSFRRLPVCWWRVERKRRERERELKRRHKRRKRGKREREKEIVGSWMNWRTREIKTELECFSSSLSRERARQKSHADFGVNYTYRIT